MRCEAPCGKALLLMMRSESLRRDIIGERQALVPRASEAGFDGGWWALRGYPFGPVVNWEKAGCE